MDLQQEEKAHIGLLGVRRLSVCVYTAALGDGQGIFDPGAAGSDKMFLAVDNAHRTAILSNI